MSVGIKDVAKISETSTATVSKVLNDSPSGVRIGEKTRQRVIQAARSLGYRPNPVAQSLRMNRTMTIGVVVEGNFIHPRLLQGAEREASKNGYSVLVGFCRKDVEREENEIRTLLHRRIDGLLLLSPSVKSNRRERLRDLVADGFPVVVLGHPVVPGLDFVDWDRQESYRELTEHLIQRGCRRFGFVGYGNALGVEERVAGIRSAIESVPGASLEHLGDDRDSQWRSYAELAALVAEPLRQRMFDALVCHTDELALAATQQAMLEKLRIPGELAVTGCGDTSIASLVPVPLTSVREPYEAMVPTAVNHLVQWIENPQGKKDALAEMVPGKVIIRRSSLFGESEDEHALPNPDSRRSRKAPRR